MRTALSVGGLVRLQLGAGLVGPTDRKSVRAVLVVSRVMKVVQAGRYQEPRNERDQDVPRQFAAPAQEKEHPSAMAPRA
jgi:hypothetical protein